MAGPLFSAALTGLPAQLDAALTKVPERGGTDVGKEFEAAFLSQGIDEMLKTAKITTFGGGHAEEMFRSFLSRAVAEAIAETAPIGIAEQVDAAIAAYQDGESL
jgi:Rod binding domain-containing protein